MKIIAIAAVIAGISGCSAQQLKPILENLDRDCTRHYAGSIGGTLGTATATFQIDCQPSKAGTVNP